MPRKNTTKTTRRSGSLFTSPADAAAMRDSRGTTLSQDPKSGMWIVRNAQGKIVGKTKSQSAGRRLRYKVEQAQGLKVTATTIARARKAKAKTSTKTKSTKPNSAKAAGTSRKRSNVKKASAK